MESSAHQIYCPNYLPIIQKVYHLAFTKVHVTDICKSGPDTYKKALYRLVTSTYLKPSTVLSHISPRDKRIKYEGEEKAKISGFPTAKELRQARETAEARLKKEEADAEKAGLVSVDVRSYFRSSVLMIQHSENKCCQARTSWCEGLAPSRFLKGTVIDILPTAKSRTRGSSGRRSQRLITTNREANQSLRMRSSFE